MAMVVKNNMAAVRTLNTLNSNSSALQKSLAKVSSGMKINSAQDDASGYAISERMRVQIRALDQANQNTQNGSSLMKTAEGAVASTIEILKTMKEKAINAATDTNTDDDRKTIQKEVDQFIDQIDDNALVTFNGKYLIEGSKAQAGDATKTAFTNQSLGAGVVGSDALTNITNRKGESLEIVSTDKVTASFVKDGTTYTTTYSVGNSTLEDIFSNLNDLRRAEITMVDSAGSETTDASAAVTFKLGSQEFNTINDSNSDAVVTVLSDAGVVTTTPPASTADVQTLVAGLSGDTATKVAEALAEQNIYADAQSAANAAADVFGAANLGVTTSNNAAEAATDAAEAAVANLATTPSQAAATTDSYNWTYTTAQARVAEADNNELKAIVAAGASALTSTNTDTAELASALEYMYTHTAGDADDATGGTALKADVDAATAAVVTTLVSATSADASATGNVAARGIKWNDITNTQNGGYYASATEWSDPTVNATTFTGGATQLTNDIVAAVDAWATQDATATLTGLLGAADAAQAGAVLTATVLVTGSTLSTAASDLRLTASTLHDLADAEMIYKAAEAVSSGGSAGYAAPFTGNDAKIDQNTYANYFLSEDQFNAYVGAIPNGLTTDGTNQLNASDFGTYTGTYNETTVADALKAVANTLNYVLSGSGSTAPADYDASTMTVEEDLSNLDAVLTVVDGTTDAKAALRTAAGFNASVEDSVKHMIDHFNSLKPKQEVEDAAAALDNVKDLIKAAVEDAYKGLTAVPDAPLDITISYDSDGDGTAEDYTFSADTDTDNTNIANNTVAQDAYDEFKNEFKNKFKATADDGLVHSGKDIGLNAAKDTVHTADDTVGLTVTAAHDSLGGQIAGLTISIANSEGQVKKTTNEFLNAFSTTIFAANESVDYSLKLHVGAQANQSISVGLQDMRAEALGLKGSDGSTLNITTQERANAAVAVLDNALAKALDQATTIGAIEARLEYTASNLTTSAENTQAAESTIRDADMAKEMTTYTKNNVLLQAAQSMLAQANQNASAVLSLLQ